MKKIKVKLRERGYQIIIQDKILGKAGLLIRKLNIGNHAFIITNPTVKKIYANKLKLSLSKQGIDSKIKVVADSEKSKSIPVAVSLIKDITVYDKNKKVFIVALGGGVIGDLAGFLASIYKRGIPYVQIPTTLLSQIDSSIGGKTAIDLKEAKNLIGAFYQPWLIISDVACLNTLAKREIRSGLAEAIKYGIIKDRRLFNYIQKYYQQLINLKTGYLETLISRCSKIKAEIVQKDEKEKKQIRTILNFGHTIGHAIEAASRYRHYNHGEAIAIGMVCAAEISWRLKLISWPTFIKIEKAILRLGLPTKIKQVSFKKILNAYYRDKKFLGKRNRFVLITKIGQTTIRTDIPLPIIKSAILTRF